MLQAVPGRGCGRRRPPPPPPHPAADGRAADDRSSLRLLVPAPRLTAPLSPASPPTVTSHHHAAWAIVSRGPRECHAPRRSPHQNGAAKQADSRPGRRPAAARQPRSTRRRGRRTRAG
jgi:hypothetical protein